MEIRSPHTKKEWTDYYKLRFDILRKPWGQSPGSEKDAMEDVGFHFACFDQDMIVGVGRLDKIDSEVFQIRFMAVDNKRQKSGVGQLLMEAMENRAWSENAQKIVLHARENAVPFYEKLGYLLQEKSHLLFEEIQHFLMHKKGMANHPLS